MDEPLAIRLDDPAALDRSLVGSKAAPLVRLHRAGFPVPEAVALTVHFFKPWVDALTAAPQWRELRTLLCNPAHADAPIRDEIEPRCAALQALASCRELDAARRGVLDEIYDRFGDAVLAVRSSAPEEDLAGASFAGLYASVLHVSAPDLADAVRTCFASCVDPRVVVYKVTRNLDPAPSFAALVQRQVASDASGVAFSLNPHNNDFDEAVINAVQGFGDKLVAGAVDPDRWVVDKVSGATVQKRRGGKSTEGASTGCLDDIQLAALTETLCDVESLFGLPVDIEWAFADSRLQLLQARPITTYVPLPEEIQTAPGKQRLLYMDPSLGEGITISGAVTPFSIDLFAKLFEWLGDYVFGPGFLGRKLKEGIVGAAGVRLYGNLSHLMHFRDLRKVAPEKRFVDTTLSELFATADLEPYRVKPPPNFARRRMLPAVWKALTKLGPFLAALLHAVLRPEAFLVRYRDDLATFEAEVVSIDTEVPVAELARRLYIAVGRVSLTATAPALLVFLYGGTEALVGMVDPSSPRHRRLVMDIRGGGDELILEMGLAMYRLARMLPAAEFGDLAALAERIEMRRMPKRFLAGWDDFLGRFGCRGPLEMDLANPKYGDDPALLLRQLAAMALGNADPLATRAERRRAREAAYAELSAQLPARKRRKLVRIHRTLEAFEGVREMPKHHFATVNMVLRRRLLASARRWVAQGRLDRVEDVFQMTVDDFDRAESDASLDLRGTVAERGAFYRDAKARVRHFPHLIDSRGRILRPVREYRPGELRGVPVSSGIVCGPAKVLDSPFDKTLLPGDVIVAHTTDPGWTPLFINAAAVLLEVGGELQHGALIAREYGKPCIAGIVGLMDSLRDGQMVEVDGDRGIVRII